MKVTIIGYTESFVLNPNVSIYKQGELIGQVSKGDKVVIDVDEPCELEFNSSFRSTKCKVDSDMCIILSFDRITGGLSAKTTKTVEDAMFELNKAKGKDNTRIIWIIIAVVASLLLGQFLKQ